MKNNRQEKILAIIEAELAACTLCAQIGLTMRLRAVGSTTGPPAEADRYRGAGRACDNRRRPSHRAAVLLGQIWSRIARDTAPPGHDRLVERKVE